MGMGRRGVKRTRYSYDTGQFGLVACRWELVGPDVWALRKIRYLGRGDRASRIVELLRA